MERNADARWIPGWGMDGDVGVADGSVSDDDNTYFYCAENLSEKGGGSSGDVPVYRDDSGDICVGGAVEVSGRRITK